MMHEYKSGLSVLICLILILTSAASALAEAASQYDYVSSNEQSSDAVSMLGNDVVFMTSNDKFFAHGSKSDYSSYGEESFLIDGNVMVDINVLKYALDISFSYDNGSLTLEGTKLESVEGENTVFVSASDVGNALSMYVYDTDNRGFVLLSDTAVEYTNSTYSHDSQEAIDFIWRYMQFDRPDGDTLYNSLINGAVYRSHPRLFVKESELSALCDRINNDPVLTKKKKLLFTYCDRYLTQDPIVPTLDGIRLFNSCYSVKERLINLCTAYLLADDEAQKLSYAQRAWEELDSACDWDNWNLTTHFLDSGEIGPGIAFAYDVLYNYLDEDSRKSVRDRVTDLYLDYCVGIYTVPRTSNYNPLDYRNVQSNWGAVCATSMLTVALTFMDEESETSELTQKCKFIAANAMQTLEHIVTDLTPEGNWDEGIGYWEYVMQHLAWSFEALDNIYGTDYNFLSAYGVDKLPDYGLYNQTELGAFNKASLTGAPNAFAPEAMIYAKLYNNADNMNLYNEFYNLVDENAFLAEYLLFYDPDMSAVNHQTELPTDKYYSSNGNSVMKGSWNNQDAPYVGLSGGKTTTYNDTHYDKGSFIFEALGERWSIDMGRNGNDTMAYLMRTETHSALVINPAANHVGQEFEAHTYAEKFESKPKGAMAIYNLTNAYAQWVDDYKRGFMFGDDRNTLTIRDELSLLQKSDLIWNMITRADIDIASDGKSAVLTQNGKKLLVTAFCSTDDWSFGSTEDLAPTGGWVDGESGFTTEKQQEFSEGAKKLTLSCSASGDVSIEVKLTPCIEGESFEPASDTPLSQWSVPDGEKQNIITIENIKNNDIVNSSNPLLINAVLDGEFENIKVYADGNLVQTVTEHSDDCRYKLVIPSECMTCAGEMLVTIVAKYPGYTVSKSLSLNICREYNKNIAANVDFSAYPDGEPTAEAVRKALGFRYIDLKAGYGAVSKAEYLGSDCLKFSLIKSNDINGGSLAYIQLDKSISDGNIIHMSFDAVASKTNLRLNTSFKKAYTIFNTNGKFFDADNSPYYEPGKPYHIDYIADSINNKYCITVSDTKGNLVAQKASDFISDGYNGEFRLSFGVSSGDDGYFLIDNIKIETADFIQLSRQIACDNETLYFTQDISAMGVDVPALLGYVAFYDKSGKLCGIESYATDELNCVNASYTLPSDTQTSKIYLWSSKLNPVAKAVTIFK